MNHCSDSQMEFANLPERNGPAPVECVRELFEALAELLGAQSQQQRVEACRKLIDGAYADRLFYVLSDPIRVETRETCVRSSRVVLLRRDTIIEIILTALASVAEHPKPQEHRHRMRADLLSGEACQTKVQYAVR